MVEAIAKIAEVASKGIEKLSGSAAEIKNKVSELDKPMRIDSVKEISESEGASIIKTLDNLDKPLNSDITNNIENGMSDVLSRKIDGMLNNGSIDSLREKYPNLDKELSNIQEELQNAETQAERIAAVNKLDPTKGRAMEALLKEAMSDLFESIEDKQISVVTAEGVTKPDLILSGAKKDITIGGTEIAKGESLGVEVKCGSAKYLREEIDHILTQVLGHGDNSLVIVTKDFNAMTDTAKSNLLNGLKERNSSICVLDIESADVKTALLENIQSKM